MMMMTMTAAHFFLKTKNQSGSTDQTNVQLVTALSVIHCHLDALINHSGFLTGHRNVKDKTNRRALVPCLTFP